MQQENELTEVERAQTDETLGNLTGDIQELKKKSGYSTAGCGANNDLRSTACASTFADPG